MRASCPEVAFLPATRITGPLPCKDRVILSEAAYPEGNIISGKKARVYAANAKGEGVWCTETNDDVIGTADLACNDDTIFAVGNAEVTALDYEGKVRWRHTSKGGTLIPGTFRGILRAGTLPIAHRSPPAGKTSLPDRTSTSPAARSGTGRASSTSSRCSTPRAARFWSRSIPPR